MTNSRHAPPTLLSILASLAVLLPMAAPAKAQLGPPGPELWTQQAFPGEVAELADFFGATLVSGDWDGDGYDDLVVGAPKEDYDGIADAGEVHALYGNWNGLAAAAAQTFRQTRDGGTDGETGDRFGTTLARGDFDDDGYDDLVVGAPNEDSGFVDSGSAQVFYGSRTGLGYERTQQLFQGAGTIDNWIVGVPGHYDYFAAALAAGDFDGDGYDDLAVGVPGDRNSTKDGRTTYGAVHVLYGGPSGLGFADDLLVHRAALGLGPSDASSDFGASLAAGDFDGDGRDDLAIGDPTLTQKVAGGDVHGCGGVYVVFGAAPGIQLTRSQFFYQGSAPSLGVAETDDAFGSALAAGDVNGDGRDDLVVGVPYEDIETIDAAGAIDVLYGAAGGLTTGGALFLHQASFGVVDDAEFFDTFGWALAVGNVVGDGFADVLVGVLGENGGAGAYHLFSGGFGGVTVTGNVLRMRSSVIGDVDAYGTALTLGDFDGNGALDVAVGAPWDETGTLAGTGLVHVTYNWAPDVVLP